MWFTSCPWSIPSIVNPGNPHNGFQSLVASFSLARLFDEHWTPALVWALTHTNAHLMAQVCRKVAQMNTGFMRHTWQMFPLIDSFHVQSELCYMDRHQGKVWWAPRSNKKLASTCLMCKFFSVYVGLAGIVGRNPWGKCLRHRKAMWAPSPYL